MTTAGGVVARLCFRSTVLLYAVVVLVAMRSMPVRVPTQFATSGLPEAWVSRGDAVALLGGAGALLALFFSVASSVPRHPRVRQDVLVLGAVSMVVLTAVAVVVVRTVTAPSPEVGPWGAAVLTLVGAAALGLLLSRVSRRVRTVLA